MKGPRELKRYVSLNRDYCKAAHWDLLIIFKLERCKKWRKRNTRSLLKEQAKLDLT